MDSAYDRKFEEMKQYIPFLEGMIKKLDTKSANNPRQAQLDKIRSLRDLLLDTKKRMKMENLLKCEQVLMNLYAKVEQRDALPSIGYRRNRSPVPEAPEPPDITQLDLVRTKLMNVVSKETLPEIQRLSETEELCSPGSKEPALFQRRPTPTPKRNYTRILKSPEQSERCWRPDSTPDKPLFSRRSPRRSPRRTSPGPSKKERIRAFKKSPSTDEKHINIKCNLSEDTFSTLRKEDLGNRILNCDVADNDIETLKVLRNQIREKLKRLGSTKDISELIFKSGKKKNRKKSKKVIEEGELSDSESEAIEKIYGSISFVDKDKETVGQSIKSNEDNDTNSHKIQISLVVNDTEKESGNSQHKLKNVNDDPELVMFKNNKSPVASKTRNNGEQTKEMSKNIKACEPDTTEKHKSQTSLLTKDITVTKTPDVITIDEEEDKNAGQVKDPNQEYHSKSDEDVSYVGSTTIDTEFLLESLEGKNSRIKKSFKPNFYNEQENEIESAPNESRSFDNNQQKRNDAVNATTGDRIAKDDQVEEVEKSKGCQNQVNVTATDKVDKISELPKINAPNEEIPLLNTEPTVSEPNNAPVSEIDILQALKNDILNESIAIPGAEPTPPLHQPKVTKVVNAVDVTKRTISIEKYKEKSVASTIITNPLFKRCPTKYLSTEDAKKQSIKLTTKECERFQFPAKLAGHSSDEETEPLTPEPDGPASPDNSAPKSPENLDAISINSTPPKIIPIDPVPSTVQSVNQSRSDVDMRLLSPPPPNQPLQKDAQLELNKNIFLTEPPKKSILTDPRVRRDINRGAVSNSPNPRAINPERTPNMTPSRTPLHMPFDDEDRSSRPKHVYAPILSSGNSRDYRERSINRDNRNPQWEPNFDPRSEGSRIRWEPPDRRQFDDRNGRNTSVHRDITQDYQKSRPGYPDNRNQPHNDYYSPADGGRTPVPNFGRSECPTTPTPSFGRQECPRTPVHPFGRGDCPTTPNPSFGRDGPMTPNHPFGREMPMTPSHPFGRVDSFGRQEMPRTPSHPFGRSECPRTPSHPFGRGEMPVTPSHPFGRGEMPITPSNPFGRGEMPITPSHPFGRGEMPVTPSHPFGRSDTHQNQPQKFVKDPRLNRANEYEDRSRNYERNRDNYDRRHPDANRPMMNYTRYGRERSVGRNETPYDITREPSIGRGSRDTEWIERFSRDNRATVQATNDFTRYGDTSRECRGYDRFDPRKNVQQSPRQSRSDYRQSDNFRSQRATSVGRNNNTLSVEPESGRSFVIDTSVNSTFQDFLNEKGLKEFGYTFDSRRKRASSVGRFLVSDIKDGSDYGHSNKPSRCMERSPDIRKTAEPQPSLSIDSNTSGYKRPGRFDRARSMGRDIADQKTEKSFNEVKADLKSFSTSKKQVSQYDKNPSENKMNYKDPRSRKDIHKIQQNASNFDSKTDKSSYSPRQNNRDPRMYREQNDYKNKYKIDNRHKRSGIVYTADNIASGSILGPGYGVKNYKIPKIKKPIEEIEKKSVTQEKKSVTSDKTSTDKMENKNSLKKTGCKTGLTLMHNNKESANTKASKHTFKDKLIAKVAILKEDLVKKGQLAKVVILKNELIKKSESETKVNTLKSESSKDKTDSKSDSHRMTRSSSRARSVSCDSKILENEITSKQRKVRKPVIESDTDDDSNTKDKKLDECKNPVKKSSKCGEVPVPNENNAAEMDDDIFDDSFTIDDFDVSQEPHINQDSLVANIDSLINDLDKNLNSKTNIVIGLETPLDSDAMLEGTVTVTKEFDVEESLHDISEVISEDLSMNTAEHNLEPPKMQSDDNKQDIESPTTRQNEQDLESSNTKQNDDIGQNVPKSKNNYAKRQDLESTMEKSYDHRHDFESTTKQNDDNKHSDNDEDSKQSVTDKHEIINSSHSKPQNTIDDNKHNYDEASMQSVADKHKIINSSHSKPQNTIDDKHNYDEASKQSVAEKQEVINSSHSNPQNTIEDSKHKYDEASKQSVANKQEVINTNHSKPQNTIDDNKHNYDEDSKKCVADKPEIINSSHSKPQNTIDALAFVSTTELAADAPHQEEKLDLSRPTEDKDVERSSTPDSTFNTIEPIDSITQDVLIVNSKETSNEMNPDITSTHNPHESTTKDSDSPRSATQIGSLGNFLSILQDKSKIKELLSLLDDQSSETEKIKKKLEKLSEIVSDDEDDRVQKYENENIGAQSDQVKDTEAQRNEVEVTVAQNKNDIQEKNTAGNLNTTSENNLKKKLYETEHPKTHDTTVGNVEISRDDLAVSKAEVKTCKDNVETTSLGSDIQKTNPKNIPIKSNRGRKPRKGKGKAKKVIAKNPKRITRAEVAKNKSKAASRELKQLQEDIQEMFDKDDILNATGLRMCRLAKLVNTKEDDSLNNEKSPSAPVVVLQKFKKKEESESDEEPQPKVRRKPGPKPKKPRIETTTEKSLGNQPMKSTLKNKPGPKSKKKHDDVQNDPYGFETDSVSDLATSKSMDSTYADCSDSESESLASSNSFGSSELLVDLRKKKRKKPGWKSGVISKRKKKTETKQTDPDDSPAQNKQIAVPEIHSAAQRKFNIPDKKCFTDKMYCFRKNVSVYSCRLCDYTNSDIVNHYKKKHPHTEIPLSRLSPAIAEKAINQSADVNFQAICKVPSERYVCRFCSKEFKKASGLETFFWHVVSMHTGEYKQTCPECINVTPCPFNLDIPPPPKTAKGQLIGYICEKCNFTQISLENLKTHVNARHNDEQTSVCIINLSDITEKNMRIMASRGEEIETEEPRKLRSSIQSSTGMSDDRTDCSESTDHDSIKQMKPNQSKPNLKNYGSKIAFEEEIEDYNDLKTSVKIEKEDGKIQKENYGAGRAVDSKDIFDQPHFKVCYSMSGAKEYVCCVNGKDNHYKTSLMISMKKHVQSKHYEVWDGYCFICKVIVTTQGGHLFKECLQHYIEKHIDNFPLLEVNTQLPTDTAEIPPDVPVEKSASPVAGKSFISVRPFDQLVNETVATTTEVAEETVPKIQEIVILGSLTPTVEFPSPSYPETVAPVVPQPCTAQKPTIKRISATPEEIQRYEEVQTEVLSKKHQVVLQTMLSAESLSRIYKCAGRYCSFTSDSAEAAWSHASIHQHQGGENALFCCYCDFNSKSNASELVTHVFRVHGKCQFSCGICFYRAVASQLVQAHIKRVHATFTGQVKILESTANYAAKEVVVPLSRDVAVKYYICVNDEANCKYKTFILDKFNEHLAKHGAPFKCSVCNFGFPTTSELSLHMKGHCLNLYQCTWCVHGADNESDLLAHASARHPGRIPQAYLRTINSKDPGKQMVLPLVKFNKASVNTQLISQSVNSEDPVREAERSIELEKLIGSIGSVASMEQATTADVLDDDEPYEIPLSPCDMDTEINLPEVPKTPEPSNPPPGDENQTTIVTLVLKTEVNDEPIIVETQANDAIICLDSDDDDEGPRTEQEPPKNVIDLSDDDAPATLNKISPKSDDKVSNNSVFSCARCYMSAKTLPAFKRHINVCYIPGTTLKCAHCVFETESKDSLFIHYDFTHFKSNKDLNKTVEKLVSRVNKTDTTIKPTLKSSENIYKCGVCDHRDIGFPHLKTHMRHHHNIMNVVMSSRLTPNSSNGKDVEYTAREGKKPGPKRKRSESSVDSPSKRIRYSLQDLDQLPVKPILDENAFCAECDFSTKVRLNLVRHLQQHADKLSVPSSVPVNPVPHLETNEKHFDKMVNLASSSVEVSREKPSKTDSSPMVTEHIPPEATSRYPKYVPDRQRHTCGAKGCSYISVDEAMLKRHWETLHDGMNDYHCVHCPPYQQLDTTTTLTAARVVGHLRMHDVNMYACSSCSYYHFKRNIVEKHLTDVHKGTGKVMIVREEATTPAQAVSPSQPAAAAPTMDLKPWQCGLCKFKSLLRPEVIEHCTTSHNSKMQFKCPNCPFRTSSVENVSKHKAKSHPTSEEEVFYYYYREGSLPDEADGTPRWQKQRQKIGNPEPEVKTEDPAPSTEILPPLAPISAPPLVDLSKVKKEFPDPEETIEELCSKYGKFCDPNGLKFKCPLCKVVMEDTKDLMQSHLFEELQYRKWGCSICPYKAFHKRGLNEHMLLEHRQRTLGAIELPLDNCIERWVDKLLEHQATLIEKNKQIIPKPSVRVEKPPSTPTTPQEPTINKEAKPVEDARLKTLEQAFGQVGAPKDLHFCCPKCEFQVKDEMAFKDHLEIELNKIRWRCSSCSSLSQTYHETQLHCKTCIGRVPARPIEAVRDPALRNSWINAAIQVQKQVLNIVEDTQKPSDDNNITNTDLLGPSNSLLVVRYEEEIPTPEEEMLARRKQLTPLHFVPSTSTQPSPESDDERLVIDEHDKSKPDKQEAKNKVGTKKTQGHQCQFCDFTSKYNQPVQSHMLRHYNLKPYTCNYCSHTCYKNSKQNHSKNHPGKEPSFSKTALPTGPPKSLTVSKKGPKLRTKSVYIVDQPEKSEKQEDTTVPIVVCMVCEKSMAETEKHAHAHDQFATKGQVVIKCCICLRLFLDMTALQEHHSLCHKESMNYAFYKMLHDTREIIVCSHCNKGFKFLKDMRTHHNTVHSSLFIKYETKPYIHEEHDDVLVLTEDVDPLSFPENKPQPVVPGLRKVSKKSTAKLPTHIAKKSTTRLPLLALNEEESSESEFKDDEYSFYGMKPQPVEKLDSIAVMPKDVKAVIPNNVMATMPNDYSENPLSLDKLKKIIPIEPKVVVKDYKKVIQ